MFRLIKEAQILTKMHPEARVTLHSFVDTVDGQSLAAVLESFVPSDSDYTDWLRVIVEEGAERGVNLSRRQVFMDLAYEVLDNDPMSPDQSMYDMIVHKLWADYKAAKQGARVEKVGRAQENEEALSRAAEYAAATSEYEPAAQNDIGDLNDNTDEFGEFDLDSESDDGMEGSVDSPDSEEADVSLSDEDIDAIASRIVDQLNGKQSLASPPPAENEEQAAPEQNKPTNMHKMLAGPRANITGAQKEIEKEGESAWTAHQLPTNPHPPKSIAHAAWERGMKKAARAHFGFVDKPPAPKKKR